MASGTRKISAWYVPSLLRIRFSLDLIPNQSLNTWAEANLLNMLIEWGAFPEDFTRSYAAEVRVPFLAPDGMLTLSFHKIILAIIMSLIWFHSL